MYQGANSPCPGSILSEYGRTNKIAGAPMTPWPAQDKDSDLSVIVILNE